MKYLISVTSTVLVAIGIITLPSQEAKKALAVGCDTYERIRGEIGPCTDGTTEYSRELWLERYRVCLDEQLAREISLYDNKVEASYSEWDRSSETVLNLDNISVSDSNPQDLSIPQMRSTTYRSNNDLCN